MEVNLVEMSSGGCGCGCSEMTVVSRATEPCGCGCECCMEETPKPKEVEVAELLALQESIQIRLAELQGAPTA